LNEARALPARYLEGCGPRCCGFEREHTLSTMHAFAEVAPRIGMSLKVSIAEARQDEIHVQAQLGLSVPLRWRPARGCDSSKDLHTGKRRARTQVRFEQAKPVECQCNGELKPVDTKFLERSVGAPLYAKSHRLQGKKCSSCSCSRLTLPSRGQPTAAHVCVLRQHLWRRCLPLMSNVRPHNDLPTSRRTCYVTPSTSRSHCG
jgi:hypothetical protein